MLKRMICMLLVLVSILGIIPVTGAAQELEFHDRTPSRARMTEVREKEPNNSRSAAKYVANDTILTGEVRPDRDADDYFYFNISSSKYLILRAVSGAGGAKSTKFRLYNSSGTLLKTAKYDGEEYTDDYFSMEYALAPGKYYIRVSDTKNWVAYQFYLYLEPQLEAPKISGANNASTGKPVIKWNAVSNAYAYRVSRSTSKNGTYKALTDVSGLSYTDDSAKAGTTYYYKVRALSASSAYRDSRLSGYITRTADLPKPTGVYVTRNATTGKNIIKWDSVSGADKYQVYVATSSNGSFNLLGTIKGTSMTHNKGNGNTVYYYKVKAIDADNSAANSAFSSVVSGRCGCTRPEITLGNVYDTGRNKITWKAVSGAVQYEVYYSYDNVNWNLLITTTETNAVDRYTAVGELCYYKVKALSSYSEADSAFSVVKYRTCDLPRPDVTISRTAAGKPRLTWEEVEGAVEYQIFRSTSKNGTYSKIKTLTGTAFNNTGAKAGKTYYYKVKAIYPNTAANSAFSVIKSIKSK